MTSDEPGSVCWEIRLRGRLGVMLLGAFPDLHARVDGAETVLAGALPDQAALHGVLARIEALGLELLELRRTPLLSVAPPLEALFTVKDTDRSRA